MALSSPIVRRMKTLSRIAVQVASGSSVHQGGLAGVTGGRLVPFNDGNGIFPLGIMMSGGGSGLSQGQNTVTGSDSDKDMASVAIDGQVLESVAVTGVTGATDFLS